jgi:hypothetical protein
MQNNNLIEIEDKIRGAVVMPKARDEFVDSLWKQLEDQPLGKSTSYLGLIYRPKWFFASVTVVVMVLIFFVVGPQRVLAAVQSLLSYLPGVGVVNNIEKAVILADPVQVKRDSYKVTVENLVASPDRTWLRIKVEGWQESPDFNSYPELQPSWPKLQIGDRLILLANLSDIYIGNALYAEYQFPSLPAGTTEVTFSLPQLPQTLKGEAPENWDFLLRLRSVEEKDLLPETWSKTWSSPMVNGVAINLLQAIQDVSGTYLTIRFDTPTLNSTLSPDWYSQLSLKDNKGQIYPVRFVKDIGGREAIFQTRPFTGGEKLKLSLDHLLLVDEPPADGSAPSFWLDLGSEPVIGEHWDLDQTLVSGAYRIHIVGVSLQKGKDDEFFRLIFEVERPSDSVRDMMFRCFQPICHQSTVDYPGNKLSSTLHPVLELSNLPSGPISIELAYLYYSIEGPWEVDWQPLVMQENNQQPISTIMLTPSVTSTQNVDVIPTAKNQETLSPRNALAEEVRQLLEKGFQTLYSQSGWIHVVYETIEQEDTENYQSGRLLGPSHSIGETWQYVEQDKTISKEVWIDKTIEGAIWQQIARDGKTQVNFTTGTANEDEKLVVKVHVENLPDLILRSNYASDVNREETVLEGQPCLLITLASRFDPPIETAGIAQRVVQSESKTWIDQKSGLIRMVQTVSKLEDGSTLILQTMRYPVKERIDEPPQEVLDLLKRVNP